MPKKTSQSCAATGAALSAITLFATSAGAMEAVVDFEEFAPLTRFGPNSPTNDQPGDFLFTDDGIGVYAADFLSTSQQVNTSQTSYVIIEDTVSFGDEFPTQELHVFGNLALRFDFTGLAFDVTRVTIPWVDMGGTQTLGVNGVVMGMPSFTDAPTTLGGVSVSTTEIQQPNSLRGTLTFEGAIDSITIGGQELTFDDVRATPTPGSAAVLLLGGFAAARRRRCGRSRSGRRW